jgi:hypothetical protein
VQRRQQVEGHGICHRVGLDGLWRWCRDLCAVLVSRRDHRRESEYQLPSPPEPSIGGAASSDATVSGDGTRGDVPCAYR